MKINILKGVWRREEWKHAPANKIWNYTKLSVQDVWTSMDRFLRSLCGIFPLRRIISQHNSRWNHSVGTEKSDTKRLKSLNSAGSTFNAAQLKGCYLLSCSEKFLGHSLLPQDKMFNQKLYEDSFGADCTFILACTHNWLQKISCELNWKWKWSKEIQA
jgi:hypothetical protein